MNDKEEVDPFEQLVRAFLAKQRIAIWGVEETRGDPGKMVVGKFRKRGVEVIEVNPKFEHDPENQRSTSLAKIEPAVEAVLIYVDPDQTMAAVEECVEARTPLVWLHDALSAGSATEEAIDRLRSSGCTVIPGLCPMFFLKPVDPAHFCLKWVLRLSGKEKRTRGLAD